MKSAKFEKKKRKLNLKNSLLLLQSFRLGFINLTYRKKRTRETDRKIVIKHPNKAIKAMTKTQRNEKLQTSQSQTQFRVHWNTSIHYALILSSIQIYILLFKKKRETNLSTYETIQSH